MPKIINLIEGQDLVCEEQETNSLFYLQKGFLGVFKRRGSQEVAIGQIQTGEIVGEMSFFDDVPRCATVTALVESEVLEIPASKFQLFFYSRPEWHRKMLFTLLKRIRSVNRKIQEGQLPEE